MYPHQDLTHKIISAAIEVHKNLGPGLLETVYSICLGLELEFIGLRFEKEVDIQLMYKNRRIDRLLRVDYIVENEVVLEWNLSSYFGNQCCLKLSKTQRRQRH
jgi:GxxExxY protein